MVCDGQSGSALHGQMVSAGHGVSGKSYEIWGVPYSLGKLKRVCCEGLLTGRGKYELEASSSQQEALHLEEVIDTASAICPVAQIISVPFPFQLSG